jgi:Flp pilus assembly pilin Flp
MFLFKEVEKMLRRFRKGQSTAEYAIVIGLVIAAVVGMQVYVKRGIQSKMKEASDVNITYSGATDYGVNSYTQYEPNYSTSTGMVSTRDSTEKVTASVGGGVNRLIVGNETSSRTGTQTITAP